MAISNANYEIILLDIGAPGRHSDGGVWRNTEIYERLENNTLLLPPFRAVEPGGVELPFVLVADEAFPLTSYMMRPYPRSGRLDLSKKVFNYRLSKARRVVENAFGLLASRMRIYRKPIIANTSTVVKIIQATVCLHNFILKYEAPLPRNQRPYYSLTTADLNLPRDGLQNVENDDNDRYLQHCNNATAIRKAYTTYFNTTGAIECQWRKALGNDF